MPYKQSQKICIFLFLIHISFCFIALPFNTIFIKNDSISTQNDYRAQMLQNELYVNFTAGTPKQNITSILKMDLYSFSLYNGSFINGSSTTYEWIDNERKINCIYQIQSSTSKDIFYLPTFNSINELDIKKDNENVTNTISKSKGEFLLLRKVKGSITKFNDIYENYGIIGLKINHYTRYYVAPEFVSTFSEIDIKTHTFYLKFNDNNINGYFNSNNSGYFVVGEELTDDENEKKNIKYTRARERLDEVNWDLAFDDLVSVSKKNSSIEYRPEYKHAELYVNFPYILGTEAYEAFISKAFFQELYLKDACDFTRTINKEEYSGYRCDSKSELFLEALKHFPDLVFEHKELEEKFILTGKDLFTYNMYNKSDTSLYFAILFPQTKDKYSVHGWILGIPFFKKFTLSFNYDNRMIGYLKKIKNEPQENSVFSSSKKEIILIVVFIFSIILAFILGMFTHKKMVKLPRKSKANELDDSYDYIQNKDTIEDENNNNDKINEEEGIDLSNKLIN